MYWETHGKTWGNIDYVADPDGLENVCHAGEAHWVNEYYGRFQRTVFRWLLAKVPPTEMNSHALDVGCGAGRWCRMLADRGYHTVGIDLQAELVEQNRQRFPDVEFVRSAIQDFTSERRFELISSVTVLQHLPFDEQVIAVRKMRELAKPGGFVIILENIADQGQHVFANSIENWQALFSSCSFRPVAIRRYDYSPGTRSVALLRRVKQILGWKAMKIESMAAGAEAPRQNRGVRDALTWIGVKVDVPIESLLVRCNVKLPTVHCGFLFEAV
jgi:trans-aconitate methyltransferase